VIVKFHRTGKGIGEGPVEYLIGKDGNRSLARILRGNAQDTIDLINSNNYAQRYKSGVLSFAKGDDLTEQQKRELMDSFENALLPGLEADQYSCFWVEHRDKRRLELNFVIPAVELRSGKRLQAYYAPSDRRRMKAWAEVKRIELCLADPNEPERKQILNIPSNLPKERKKIPETITNGLLVLIEQGEIKNRADVIIKLKEFGFSIVREAKSSISIADVNGGQNIRLKGEIYEQDFRYGAGVRAESEKRSADYRTSSKERFECARAELFRGIEIKRAELIKRYGRERKAITREAQTEQSSYVSNDTRQMDSRNNTRISNNFSSSFADVLFHSETSQIPRRDSAVEARNISNQQNIEFTSSAIQGIKRNSHRTQGKRYEYLGRPNIYIGKSPNSNIGRKQGKESSLFEERANQTKKQMEKIDERDRAIAIRKFTEDRNQSTRIVEQIFRRFNARIQAITRQFVSWFEEFKQSITTRDTSARTIITRSNELKQQNKLVNQWNERIGYANKQFSKFNAGLSAFNKSIRSQSNTTISIIHSTNNNVGAVIGAIQQRLEQEKQRKEKEQKELLEKQHALTNKVIRKFEAEAFCLRTGAYGYNVHHIYGEGKNLKAMPSQLKKLLYDYISSDQQAQNSFLDRLKNNISDVKTLNNWLNAKNENYQELSRNRGRSR